jgi:hypothetical protein
MLATLRIAVLDALEARGFVGSEAIRARVLGETSVERLRAWLRRAVVVSEAGALFEV